MFSVPFKCFFDVSPFAMGLLASASGSSTPTASDWKSVIDAVIGSFSSANIVAVLASVVGAGIVFVFLWWGIRLAFRSIMGAVKNGTLSINSGRRRR